MVGVVCSIVAGVYVQSFSKYPRYVCWRAIYVVMVYGLVNHSRGFQGGFWMELRCLRSRLCVEYGQVVLRSIGYLATRNFWF